MVLGADAVSQTSDEPNSDHLFIWKGLARSVPWHGLVRNAFVRLWPRASQVRLRIFQPDDPALRAANGPVSKRALGRRLHTDCFSLGALAIPCCSGALQFARNFQRIDCAIYCARFWMGLVHGARVS